MNFRRFLVLAACLGASTATGATLTIEQEIREVTSAEVADGAPLGAFVHDFYLSAPQDLLSFGSVAVTAPLYRHAWGVDQSAPSTLATTLAPALSVHSYITTPGDTFIAGASYPIESGVRSYADTADTGATSHFHFARLTTTGVGRFSGNVALRGLNQPVSVPFDLDLPWSGAGLGSLLPTRTFGYQYDEFAALPPPPGPNDFPPGPDPVLPPPPAGYDPTLHNGDVVATIRRQSRPVTASEVAGGAPVGGRVFEFFVSTQLDILSVTDVVVAGDVFQAPGMTSAHPAPDAVVPLMPVFGASSFITTPGTTGIAGDPTSWTARNAYFDTERTGATTDFRFAQLTVAGNGGFNGRLALAGSQAPLSFPFDFALQGDSPNEVVSLVYNYEPPAATLPPAPTVPTVVMPPAIDPAPTPPHGIDLPPNVDPPNIIDRPPLVAGPPSFEPPLIRPPLVTYIPGEPGAIDVPGVGDVVEPWITVTFDPAAPAPVDGVPTFSFDAVGPPAAGRDDGLIRIPIGRTSRGTFEVTNLSDVLANWQEAMTGNFDGETLADAGLTTDVFAQAIAYASSLADEEGHAPAVPEPTAALAAAVALVAGGPIRRRFNKTTGAT